MLEQMPCQGYDTTLRGFKAWMGTFHVGFTCTQCSLVFCLNLSPLQIKRSDSAFFWEEREIMANANSEWIVQVALVLNLLAAQGSLRTHHKWIGLIRLLTQWVIAVVLSSMSSCVDYQAKLLKCFGEYILTFHVPGMFWSGLEMLRKRQRVADPRLALHISYHGQNTKLCDSHKVAHRIRPHARWGPKLPGRGYVCLETLAIAIIHIICNPGIDFFTALKA